MQTPAGVEQIHLTIRVLPRAIQVAVPIRAETTAESLELHEPGRVTVIVISSQADWVDSGISLRAGQSFTIAAYGRMNPCADTYPNGEKYCVFYAPQGAAGVVTQHNEYGIFPALEQRFMALLGRIGDGEPFYIGAGGTFTAEQAGRLWLTPNDNTRTDNQGAYTVLIRLEDDQPGGG